MEGRQGQRPTGHSSLGISACAGFVVGQYLLDPAVAPEVDGATCPAEYNPFDLVAPGGSPGTSAAEVTNSALIRGSLNRRRRPSARLQRRGAPSTRTGPGDAPGPRPQ